MTEKPKATENKAEDVETATKRRNEIKTLLSTCGKLWIQREILSGQVLDVDKQLNAAKQQLNKLGWKPFSE